MLNSLTLTQRFKPVFTLLLSLYFMCSTDLYPQIYADEMWEFNYDPDNTGFDEEWYKSNEKWTLLTEVPGFWKDNNYDGYGWYKTVIKIKEKISGKRLALIFESVDDNADVWLNGVLIGSHNGWGEKFWFDITNEIIIGINNRIVVRIEDIGGPGGINGRVYMKWFDDEKEFVKSPFSELTAVKAPDWLNKAIIYELFVRDFSPAGNFNGVTEKLDDLKELGIDCIWLMPIHPVGKINRKGEWGSPYSCVDYYAVSPDFGTLEDFRHLVQETHKRNMRLILDMVLNHSAWDSPLITEHPDWYTRNRKGQIISPVEDWWDVADLNYESPELRKYMIEMLTHWVKEFDVDGFRFDVAELVPMDFWIDARNAVKSIKPDALFLAEGDKPDLHIDAFDLTYSWNIWRHVLSISNRDIKAEKLVHTLTNETNRYPYNSPRMRFVENHDKQRAAQEIPSEALKLAHAVIYTIPGVPLLYNGQEIALSHRLKLFPKDPIDWSAGDYQFRNFLIELGTLKHSLQDLSSYDWKPLNQVFPPDVIGWWRGDSTICFANFGESPKTFSSGDFASEYFEIAYSISKLSTAAAESGILNISLGPWDLILLKMK